MVTKSNFIMLKLSISLILGVILYSCNDDLPGFRFDLFKGTPAWELAKAVENQDTIRISKILEDRVVNVDYQEPKFGNTLLMLAVVNNKKLSVQTLLKNGANPNKQDAYDNATSVIYACGNNDENCDTSILKLLIQFSGDVNAIQEIDRNESTGAQSIVKKTPLMIAASNNCLDVVKVLLDNGADINKYTYYEGYGAITAALIQDKLGIAKYLIVERKAILPQYCFIRNRNEKDERKLSIEDMLLEQHYEPGSTNDRLKNEILAYLQKRSK